MPQTIVEKIAQAHMTEGPARPLRTGDFLSIQDIARVLKRRLGDAARRVPTRQLPNWLVRLAALRDPAVKQILPELGKRKNATGEKARRVLGWAPRSTEEALAATAESLVRLGLLKDSPRKPPP